MVAFFSFPLTPLIGYNDYGGLPSPLDGRRKTPWHYDGEVYVATTLTLAAKRRLQMDAMMSTVRSATIWLFWHLRFAWITATATPSVCVGMDGTTPTRFVCIF